MSVQWNNNFASSSSSIKRITTAFTRGHERVRNMVTPWMAIHRMKRCRVIHGMVMKRKRGLRWSIGQDEVMQWGRRHAQNEIQRQTLRFMNKTTQRRTFLTKGGNAKCPQEIKINKSSWVEPQRAHVDKRWRFKRIAMKMSNNNSFYFLRIFSWSTFLYWTQRGPQSCLGEYSSVRMSDCMSNNIKYSTPGKGKFCWSPGIGNRRR